MSPDLDKLLRNPGVWRGNQPELASQGVLSTGFVDLDRVLPAGGWPLGALTEILSERIGVGELPLVMPALSRLSAQGRWIAWIAPPYIPYAPALAAQGIDLSRQLLVHTRSDMEVLWAWEQMLRSGSCGAVLAWPARTGERSLRRLQLAAEAGCSWALLFDHSRHAQKRSPVALRLKVDAFSGGVVIQILKCRGRGPSSPLSIELKAATSVLTTFDEQAGFPILRTTDSIPG